MKPEFSEIELKKRISSRIVDADTFDMVLPFTSCSYHELTSWDEVELLCASQGIDISQEIVNFFMAGMLVYQNITEMMIDQMANGDWLRSYLKTASDFQVIYLISCVRDKENPPFAEFRQKLAHKWASLVYPNSVTQPFLENSTIFISKGVLSTFSPSNIYHINDAIYSGISSYVSRQMQASVDASMETALWRKKLLNAVDLANPLIMLKFYSELDKSQFADDIEFVKYLVSRTEIKARYRPEFSSIATQLKKELADLRKYKMHIN